MRLKGLPGLVAAFVLGVAAASASGCGDDEENPLSCTAQSCMCEAQQTCDISPDGCGPDSCSLDCEEGSSCEGSCGDSCSVDCRANATCDLTVGKSGSVSCAAGSVCTVTCTDDCSVSCGAEATCAVQCPGDTEPQAVTEGASCQAA